MFGKIILVIIILITIMVFTFLYLTQPQQEIIVEIIKPQIIENLTRWQK